MTTAHQRLTAEEHVGIAREFLANAQREFADGETLQASEKLWGAASHAVMAVAMQRNWAFGDHRSLKLVVRRLAEERGEPSLKDRFMGAEKFHANFYHAFMQDFEFDDDSPVLYEFVERLIAIAGGA